jgi:hypothetical protein
MMQHEQRTLNDVVSVQQHEDHQKGKRFYVKKGKTIRVTGRGGL